MLYFIYCYFCLEDNKWFEHPRIMGVNHVVPTVCSCHGVAYKTGSLYLFRVDCEIKKINNAVMNGNVNLDKNTAVLTDVINRLECICVCLDQKKILNYIDQ